MYKNLALAAVLIAALTMLGFEANEWIPVEQLAGQGVYVVKSIEHNPEGTVLREIRIDLQSPHKRDVAWYAGESMDRFSLRGNPRDVRLGSKLVCSKETKVRLLTHKEIPGSERYRCSTDIERPGNRRVFSFVAYRIGSARVDTGPFEIGRRSCARSHSPASHFCRSVPSPPRKGSNPTAAA